MEKFRQITLTTCNLQDLFEWFFGTIEDSFNQDNECEELIKEQIFVFDEHGDYEELTKEQYDNLINNLNTEIEVESTNCGNVYTVIDNEFTINDITYSFQSTQYPGIVE